jgi:[pyruvate, water dikinase]-phosphate phosphotransferase / [pyruvate, water dikinase] kinase
MDSEARVTQLVQGPPVFVVSGGPGASGELLARTVLAQFPEAHVPLIIESKVLSEERVRQIIARVATIPGAIILHTMVNRDQRRLLVSEAAKAGVFAFDVAGPLLEHMSRELKMEPVGQPGLYRKLHSSYFARIEAIEFTVAHDDGQRVEELGKAEIVLIGVSRAGKTPLSMYLSVLGWKVANVPFVPMVPMPEELFAIDMRRVIGLMIEPAQLLIHRKVRQQRTGIPEGAYVNHQEVVEELRAANHFFYRHGISVVDTTNKSIESSADEIAVLIARKMAG